MVDGVLVISLTVEALQGKRCQDSLLSGLFLVSTKLRHILLSDSANCTVLRAVVLTQYRRVTDGQTDGIAVASTALAKRRAVKRSPAILNNQGSTPPLTLIKMGINW